MTEIRKKNFSREFIFSATRSSGPGGQNVNKVNSRVELRFNVSDSELLTEREKLVLQRKLSSQITSSGFIIIVSQSERSQLKNKQESIEKFYSLMEKSLKTKKKRKPTKPTAASMERRIQSKKIISEKKSLRKKID